RSWIRLRCSTVLAMTPLATIVLPNPASSATRNLSTASGSFHRRSITWSTVARWKGCRDCITCSAVTCSVLRSSIAHLRDVRLPDDVPQRSEEHTSELQSRFDLVCRLLL